MTAGLIHFHLFLDLELLLSLMKSSSTFAVSKALNELVNQVNPINVNHEALQRARSLVVGNISW